MFTAKIITNDQNDKGDLVVSMEYSNGGTPIIENYPAEANSATMLNTIASRIAQLQSAEDFVTSNPPGTELQGVSESKPLEINISPSPVVGTVLKPI